MYPQRAPIAEGEGEYTRSGHHSRKGRENIPVAGTNRRREGEHAPEHGHGAGAVSGEVGLV
eukprot:8625671-Pyramimonas_sp.AAC.1